IEVTFSISPKLRRLPHHDPETLPVEDFHWKLHFGHDGRLPGQDVRFVDVLRGFVRGMTFLPPGTTTVLRADLGPGALAGVNVQTQAAFTVPISGDPVLAPTLLKIDYDGKRFLPALPA
ncbi:adenylate/guanylate cyclase domain-containing protein, partial [Mesorhizobium sp. M4B.F.Ca.ET.169.01.1.1]